jgi:hypothetical protein
LKSPGDSGIIGRNRLKKSADLERFELLSSGKNLKLALPTLKH